MFYEKINLSDKYSFLKEMDSVATVEVYVQEDTLKKGNSSPKRGMVVCPGSGYFQCARIESEAIAVKLLAMDFNVFVITYSCAPHHHPLQILEVAALYDFLSENSERYNIDIDKVGIMGFSAGGHLAAHYSNRYNSSEITSVFSKVYKPFVSVLGYPVLSADPEISHKSSFEYLLGHAPDDKEIAELSCENMVSEDTPPTFIWHTVEDQAVPVLNSIRYAEALGKKGVTFTMHIYPYGSHGLSTADKMTQEVLTEKTSYAHDWLNQFEKWISLL